MYNLDDWEATAKELVYVESGANAYIGLLEEQSDDWVFLRNALRSGLQRVQVPNPNGGSPQQAIVPTPDLLPWLVAEPVRRLAIRPDVIYNFSDQSTLTQEAASKTYLDFLNHLEAQIAERESRVKLATGGELAAINAAAQDPKSLLNKFGPVGVK